MPGYNLNERQRQIVRELVSVYEGGYTGEFVYAPTLGSEAVIEFYGPGSMIRADETDLITLEREGFVTLRRAGQYSRAGTLRQRAYDAAGSDFELPDVGAMPAGVTIANFINTMMGGSVQGATGTYVTMNQQITHDPEVLVQRFSVLTDQLTEVLTQILEAQDLRDAIMEVSAVQAQVESADPDAASVATQTRSLAERILAFLDVGDKLGGTIQAGLSVGKVMIVLGGWTHTAYQVLQTLVD